MCNHNSLSARMLHRAPPPPLAPVDQHFLTPKIVADPKMQCHENFFGIWRVTEAILGKKTFFFKKHILKKINNKSHYFSFFRYAFCRYKYCDSDKPNISTEMSLYVSEKQP